MADDKTVVIRRFDPAAHADGWHAIAQDSGAGHMQQCLWWLDPLRGCGVAADGIGIWRGDRLVGGGLFRSIPVPYLRSRLTQCLSGPIAVEWRSEWADAVVSELAALGRERGSMEIRIEGCRGERLREDLLAALRGRGCRIGVVSGSMEAYLPVEGRSFDDLWRRMSEGTRRHVNKARRQGVEIRSLREPGELRAAHETWMATARRKGFSDDVRPWEYLGPVVRHSVERGLGEVLASVKDGRVLASIWVTYLGRQASYVYGGFLDGAEGYCPNHLLHVEATRRCLEKGLPEYDLGVLTDGCETTPNGVDRYKFGFGAQPRRQPESIVWKRRPLLAGGTEWIRRRSVGRRVASAVRRRLLAPRADR